MIIQCLSNENKNTDIIKSITAIKKAGFDGVFLQFYHRNYEMTFLEQLKQCRSVGLKVEWAHLEYKEINNIWLDNEIGNRLVDDYIDDLNVCKNNNINLVIMHLASKKNPPAPNMLGISRVEKIIKHAQKLNIQIAFENTKVWGYLEYLFENINNENMGVCLDTGHYHCHYNDNFSWNTFENKIIFVHLHDNDGTDDQHLLPFDGTLNWTDTLKKLKVANYNGDIVLESCNKNNIYDDISIDEFYNLAYQKAIDIQNILNG